MALTDVKRAIEEKTKAEVEGILEHARVEAERILAEAKEQVTRAKETHDAQTKELLAAMERKEKAASAFQHKTVLLEEKRKAIDAVFALTQEQLANQTGNQRQDILDTLTKKTEESGMQVATVRCNAKDVAALKRAFAQATISADDNIIGGFVADDASGTVRLDYTYDTILHGVSEQVLGELTEKLFSR